ncbi:hypothetical protein BJV77DRAFT_963587 [Russula vinacea]|nr:hypothetical protein BJV77DRAFT_963587 [Russula vinacea]
MASNSTTSGNPHSRKRKERASSTNPDDIIEGPQKWKATSRVTDNADPLLLKNKAISTTTQPKQSRPKATRLKATPLARHGPSWHPSVDSEDEDEEGHVIPAARQTRGSDVDDNDLAESVHSDDDGPEVVDIISSDEEPEESSEDELKRLAKDWNSPIYAFFKPIPFVDHIDVWGQALQTERKKWSICPTVLKHWGRNFNK